MSGARRRGESPIANRQWPRVRLGEVCEIQLGKMLSPASKTGKYPRPYLRNANVQWGRFDLQDLAEMDFSPEQEKKFALKAGDLLVCEGGEPGRAAVWSGQITPCFYQKALHRLRPIGDMVDPEFVMFRLWLGAMSEEFAESHAKTTIAHLPAIRLARLPIHLPPLPEQRRIAARLKEQLAAAEAARTAAEARSKELDALVAAALHDSLASPGAESLAADAVLDEVTAGVGPRWREFPVIGATRDGWAPAREPAGKAPERYKLVKPGMVFYNPMRIMIGSIAAVSRPEQVGVTSPDYVVVKPNPDRLDSVWFYEWLRSTYGSRFISSLARGAVRERMLFSRLRKGVLPIPPFAAQQCFAAICSVAREGQEALAAQLAELDALPGALLREAFDSRL